MIRNMRYGDSRNPVRLLHDWYVAPIVTTVVASVVVVVLLSYLRLEPATPSPIIGPANLQPAVELVVVEVFSDTSATRLVYEGKRYSLDPGDVILRINGNSMSSLADFSQVIDGAPRGARLPIELLDGGRRATAVLELDPDSRYRAGFSVKARPRRNVP